MTAEAATDFQFDPFAPTPVSALPPIWATLRDHFPVYRTAYDMWVVSRYEDVRFIQQNPQLFSSKPNADEASALPTDAADNPEQMQRLMAVVAGFPQEVDVQELVNARTIVAADPPDHTRLRRIVNRGFTPGSIERIAARIEAIVDECLEGIETDEVYELVSRLAIPMPVAVIADLLGVEPAMRPKIKEWSDGIAAASVGDIRGTAEAATLAMTVMREFSEYLAPLIEQRRTDPKDDILSAMVRSMESETLTTPEALMMAQTIMAAGNETTTDLIGNAVVAFYDHPDQLELLRADPALLPAAVEEALRFSTPIQFNFREALQDYEIAGTVIPKGATIIMYLAAANRDPRQFEDADTFRITRPVGGNLALGHGIHFCLGAHLARLEGRIALAKLLPHFDRFELDTASLGRNPFMVLHGVPAIPLTAKASRT
jgi:cytochrome P450